MRTLWIAIATAVIGCSTGLALTYYEAATIEDQFDVSYGSHDADTSPDEVVPNAKVVVVGNETFDFGTLERNQTGTCTFTIRNESVATLSVGLEGVSCGLCIQTEFSDAEVPTGQEFSFDVDYTTHKEGPQFSEYVEMKTSDPVNPVIRFNITGYVTKRMRFSKREILLGDISAGEDVSSEFRIYGFDNEPMEIIGHEFSDTLSARFFKLELTPLEPEEYQEQEPRANSAYQATLRLTQGKPLGPLAQSVVIKARFGEHEGEGEIAIRGKIVSDILLIGGRDFLHGRSLVQLRTIDGTQGHDTTLRIRVRGPHRDQVKLSVGDIDPEGILTASIGEPTVVGSGYLYPLHIKIPPGSPSVNRLGSQQGKVGRINIETTHPSAKLVPVYVSFAVK